jgi:hypothetical protein
MTPAYRELLAAAKDFFYGDPMDRMLPESNSVGHRMEDAIKAAEEEIEKYADSVLILDTSNAVMIANPGANATASPMPTGQTFTFNAEKKVKP